jgi:hypothetical protein
MNRLFPLLLLCSTAFADPPSIVGPPTDDVANGVVRVQVGNPPWVPLTVKDAPDKSVQTWSGAIGPDQVGFYLRDGGIGVATPIVGTYPFRCIIQTPNEGLDTIQIVDVTVVVEGNGPVPPQPPPPVPPKPPTPPNPPVPPQPNVWDRITEAVKANPDASLKGVADMYDTVGAQATAGALTIPQIQAAHQLASALSPAWATISASLVDPYLKTLTLAKPGDYAPVWHQLAAAIRSGMGPQPPPEPPVPPQPPVPITTGLHVLIIEETNNRGTLPAAQAQIFTSTKVLGWLRTNAPAHWRIWDADVDASKAPTEFQDAIKLPRTGLPWVVISNGTTGFSGPLPANETDTLSLLEKYRQ